MENNETLVHVAHKRWENILENHPEMMLPFSDSLKEKLLGGKLIKNRKSNSIGKSKKAEMLLLGTCEGVQYIFTVSKHKSIKKFTNIYFEQKLIETTTVNNKTSYVYSDYRLPKY